MTLLSVNVNKIATLRNSRGQDMPNLLSVSKDIVKFGARGLTIHPRPDERHITKKDAQDIGNWLSKEPHVEFNIEGYPHPDFIEMICMLKPHQCTLVPDPPNTLTSNAGWNFHNNLQMLIEVNKILKAVGVRVSLFLDPFEFDEKQKKALLEIQPQRVELYTEKYARDYQTANKENSTLVYKSVAEELSRLGIQINAGHDLNQKNLAYLIQQIPCIKEVSIGHALICESLYDGLEKTIKNYLKICH